MGAAVKASLKAKASIQPPPAPAGSGFKIAAYGLGICFVAALGIALVYEARTSQLQARFASEYAKTLTYDIAPGPSDALFYPTFGPFDQRLGYTRLPAMLTRLEQQGFVITEQARFSEALLNYTRHGFYPPYPEKTQTGLRLYDCRGDELYQFNYPSQGYQHFAQIPKLVVDSLLFIEDRNLLSHEQQHNPAVNWPRLAKASLSQASKALELEGQSAGGSTLATQIEKFRHAQDGRTQDFLSKVQQMVSASIRTYQHGPATFAERQRIIQDYLNSVPLAAAAGYGEVNGLADGLKVWFAADFTQTNALLAEPTHSPDKAQALRQVLALIIAQRRPSWYLLHGRTELEALIDSHLRLISQYGYIQPRLRDQALAMRTEFRQQPLKLSVPSHKSLVVTRNRLSQSLAIPLYELDRLDLTARTSLDARLQEQVTQYLQSLADTDTARTLGLVGERLLSPSATDQVRYSFTLFENTATGAEVRVQTDSTQQPFDLNESSKLELGSTAKLRVLTTYLQMIAELYQRFSGLDRVTLLQFDIEPMDVLSRWAADYLLANPNASLAQMLDDALERRYSASPYEDFFTGGGVHRFNNFNKDDNKRLPSLKVAMRESINLPFVRLMRDLVRYSLYQSPNNSAALLKNDHDPRRAEYLARFADREGQVYTQRFWRKYQGLTEDARLSALIQGLTPTAPRLAAIYRYLYPEHDLGVFEVFLRAKLSEPLSASRIQSLYDEYHPGRWSLPDQGYLAKVHPLELWVLRHGIRYPDASLEQVIAQSYDERQEVYGWLFKTRHKGARDSRIRTLLEVEAFMDIHQRWQQLGYPFGHLVPSLATALGSSGDRPGALAELMGIIQNNGVRLPTVRLNDFAFAQNTPYASRLSKRQDLAVQVMPVEVAQALKAVLAEVVNQGTARRIMASFTDSEGQALVIGGKTGTGDNRIQKVAANGQVLSSTALNRTATFVFYLGDRHYGTLTAFVPGKSAEGFGFTSALPVQVLKGMTPILAPYLNGGLCR